MKADTVIEGTWEEIARHAGEFTGHKLRLTVLEENSDREKNGSDVASKAEADAQAYRAWAEGHLPTTPLLSDEAIGRESIYGERG